MIKDNLEKGVPLILVTDSWRIGPGVFQGEIHQKQYARNRSPKWGKHPFQGYP